MWKSTLLNLNYKMRVTVRMTKETDGKIQNIAKVKRVGVTEDGWVRQTAPVSLTPNGTPHGTATLPSTFQPQSNENWIDLFLHLKPSSPIRAFRDHTVATPVAHKHVPLAEGMKPKDRTSWQVLTAIEARPGYSGDPQGVRRGSQLQ